MSAILKFDFQKREQLRFSEMNYLSYTKKDPILHVATTFSLKQGETRTSHGAIPHPLIFVLQRVPYYWQLNTGFSAVAEKPTSIIFKECIMLGLNFILMISSLMF